jgi:hypothetical protein
VNALRQLGGFQPLTRCFVLSAMQSARVLRCEAEHRTHHLFDAQSE